MNKFLFFILFFISDISFCYVKSEIYIDNDGVKKYTFHFLGSKLMKCDNLKSCEIIFNSTKGYCKNLSAISNELDKISRVRWECPKYLSMYYLRNEIGLRFPNEPVLFEYSFNVYKLISNFKFINRDDGLYFYDVNTMIGISPRNIYIPAEINDFVKNIVIFKNKEGYITNEKYELENSIVIHRNYGYCCRYKKIKFVETYLIKENKVLYKEKSEFE